MQQGEKAYLKALASGAKKLEDIILQKHSLLEPFVHSEGWVAIKEVAKVMVEEIQREIWVLDVNSLTFREDFQSKQLAMKGVTFLMETVEEIVENIEDIKLRRKANE